MLETITKRLSPQQFWQMFVCKRCGYCCTQLGIHISELELRRIANHLHRRTRQLKKLFEVRDGVYFTQQCPFYQNNACLVYEVRPKSCRDFPIYRQDNTLVIHQNCPAGMEVYDKLKEE